MKNIILIFTILFSAIVYSQDSTPKPGDNILDPGADKFVGNWLWQEGTTSLTIILKKENVLIPFIKDVRADFTLGYHKFIKDGIVVEDYTMFSNKNFSDKKNSITSGTDSDNRNILNGYIIHSSKDKSIKFELEYIDANHIKLRNLKNKEGVKIRVPGQPAYDWSISLPQNIILTRQ